MYYKRVSSYDELEIVYTRRQERIGAGFLLVLFVFLLLKLDPPPLPPPLLLLLLFSLGSLNKALDSYL